MSVSARRFYVTGSAVLSSRGGGARAIARAWHGAVPAAKADAGLGTGAA